MITPAIPSWLPEQLWNGLHFEDMEDCARKWVKIIKEKGESGRFDRIISCRT